MEFRSSRGFRFNAFHLCCVTFFSNDGELRVKTILLGKLFSVPFVGQKRESTSSIKENGKCFSIGIELKMPSRKIKKRSSSNLIYARSKDIFLGMILIQSTLNKFPWVLGSFQPFFEFSHFHSTWSLKKYTNRVHGETRKRKKLSCRLSCGSKYFQLVFTSRCCDWFSSLWHILTGAIETPLESIFPASSSPPTFHSPFRRINLRMKRRNAKKSLNLFSAIKSN